MGEFIPHIVPHKAFCNYCKNADVRDCIVHTQILRLPCRVPLQCDNNADGSNQFLVVIQWLFPISVLPDPLFHAHIGASVFRKQKITAFLCSYKFD